MRFIDVPGSLQVKDRLIQSVKAVTVPHAQLFAGQVGALNLPMALAFTTYLHCQNKGEHDACGECAACSKSLKHIHPDTNFVFPLGNVKGDKDEDRFKAEIMKAWRSFLTEQPFGNLDDWASYYGGEDKQAIISKEESREIIKSLSLKSFESPYKVMLIWQPEYMHPSAANGILKILEEPPPNTFFLLVTNAAERLLPTIISRTQIVQIPMLSDEEVNAHLKSLGSIEASKRDKIVQLAEGNLNLALKLIDQEEDHHFELFFNWMLACFKKEYGKLVTMADDFHTLDKMNQRNLMTYSLNMMRETLLQLSGATTINRSKGNELERVQKFSKLMNVSRVEKSSHLINDAAYHLERNGSAKMIFMDLSLQLSNVINP
jgi:DNA polymerase III subunit delta'